MNTLKNLFPHLPALVCTAHTYLCVARTSNKRLFSVAIHVIHEKRNLIHCDKAGLLIFLQKKTVYDMLIVLTKPAYLSINKLKSTLQSIMNEDEIFYFGHERGHEGVSC